MVGTFDLLLRHSKQAFFVKALRFCLLWPDSVFSGEDGVWADSFSSRLDDGASMVE